MFTPNGQSSNRAVRPTFQAALWEGDDNNGEMVGESSMCGVCGVDEDVGDVDVEVGAVGPVVGLLGVAAADLSVEVEVGPSHVIVGKVVGEGAGGEGHDECVFRCTLV